MDNLMRMIKNGILLLWLLAFGIGLAIAYATASNLSSAFSEARIALIDGQVEEQRIQNERDAAAAYDEAEIARQTRGSRIATQNAATVIIAVVLITVAASAGKSFAGYAERRGAVPIVQELPNGRALVSYTQLVAGKRVTQVALLDDWTGENELLSRRTGVTPERAQIAMAKEIQTAASQQVVTAGNMPSANPVREDSRRQYEELEIVQ